MESSDRAKHRISSSIDQKQYTAIGIDLHGMGVALTHEKIIGDALKLEELLYILSQPTRRKVLEALLKSTVPLYIKEIADLISESERNTSFHLTRLAKNGLVEGEFRAIDSENGRPAKYYRLKQSVKPKVKKIIELEI